MCKRGRQNLTAASEPEQLLHVDDLLLASLPAWRPWVRGVPPWRPSVPKTKANDRLPQMDERPGDSNRLGRALAPTSCITSPSLHSFCGLELLELFQPCCPFAPHKLETAVKPQQLLSGSQSLAKHQHTSKGATVRCHRLHRRLGKRKHFDHTLHPAQADITANKGHAISTGLGMSLSQSVLRTSKWFGRAQESQSKR